MKDKVTFTPCLKKKYSTDKEGIVNIRVTENRKSKYFSTKVSINEDFWNSKRCEVKSKHKDSETINSDIKNKIEELKKVYSQTDSVNDVKTNDKNSFLVYFRSYINLLITRKKIGTSKNTQTCLTHLTTFVKSRNKIDLLFSEISIEIVTDFETYLLGKNIAPNTTKKYVSIFGRVYNLAIKSRIFIPTSNPFILFENERLPVEKKRLEKKHVEVLFNTRIDENDILFKVKNYFLFQIFAQGIRVGDLLTLRWSNIKEGEIVFTQLKTKKLHFVGLNEIVVLILKDFLPDKCKDIMDEVHEINVDKKYILTFEELKSHYYNLVQSVLFKLLETNFSKDEKAFELAEKWKDKLDQVKEIITTKLIIRISQYAKEHSKEFIFGLLNESDFKDVDFTPQTRLTKFQYNQISSKTAVYNKQLKRLQKTFEMDITFTSHLPRHTYTNLLIESTDRDIYVISKSLGHRRLSATEHYVDDFNKERIDKGVGGFTKQFNLR